MSKIKSGIMGSGYLAGTIVDGYLDGTLHEYELVGILGRTLHKTATITEGGGYRARSTVEEPLALKPDIVAGAASVQCVRDNAQKILSTDVNLIVLSISAFANGVFYDRIKETAIRHNSKAHIASGAVGGFDVLRTISLMGQAKSDIHTKKGPASLMNIPLYDDDLMAEEGEPHVFLGNAKEAVSILPTEVNMAVAASLAITGPGDTSVNISSVPGMVRDDHKITTGIDGVKATADIYSSTSATADRSVMTVLKDLVSLIVFQDVPLQTEGTQQIRRIN